MFLAVGPLVGGVLTELVSWRTVFWLNVPVGIATLILVRVARPRNTPDRSVEIKSRFVALLICGVGLTVLGIQQAGQWGWGSLPTLLTIGVGLLTAGWFVVDQLRARQPLVDVRLFAQRAFLANLVVLGLVQFALLPVILYSSLYQQELLGLSPIECGVAVLPMILALAGAAQIGGRWYDRSGVRPPVLTGLVLAVVGLAAWAFVLPELKYPVQAACMVVMGFGLGLLMSPTNTDALGRVSDADRNQASGLVQTARQLGGTLGIALVGAVVVARQSEPSGSPSADAIAVGFWVAAAAFGVALVLGWLMLSRDRILGAGPSLPITPTVGVAQSID